MSIKTKLPDVQNTADQRGKAIQKVGINEYKIPFRLKDRENNIQPTVGTISMYTSLTEHTKGVNMSRFSQVIEKALEHNVMSCDFVDEVVTVLKERLESNDSYLKIKFPYFIKKTAPVSKNVSHFVVDCILEGRAFANGEIQKYLTVEVSYTSLCACSKEMSLLKTQLTPQEIEHLRETLSDDALFDKVMGVGFGAHNQRSKCKITVQLKDFIWIEDLAQIVNECASCEIFNTLKREDEKWVTEKAYQDPRFVEDMAREVAIRMDKLIEEEKTDGWLVVVENYESIHQSNAVAVIRGGDHYIP